METVFRTGSIGAEPGPGGLGCLDEQAAERGLRERCDRNLRACAGVGWRVNYAAGTIFGDRDGSGLPHAGSAFGGNPRTERTPRLQLYFHLALASDGRDPGV